MMMSPEQEALVVRVFESYVTEHHLDDLQQLITDENEETHQPVVVNAMTLFEANMEVRTFSKKYGPLVRSLVHLVHSPLALSGPLSPFFSGPRGPFSSGPLWST